MSSSFIQEFRRLPVHEREQSLVALTTELTPYEWRALSAVISSRSFQFDIIGRLPVELVARIFSYLDPAAPYRCQVVSRQWNHVLRSPDVLKVCLHSWHQGTAHLQHADYDVCKSKSKEIHAFRTGHATDIYSVRMKELVENFALAGNYLIWTPRDDARHACVLNLDTWQFRNLAGAGRERIGYVVASDQIVVLATNTSTCYVYELGGTWTRKKFSLPNRRYQYHMVCRGRTVACVLASDRHTCVFIWEFDTQRGRSFEIDNLTDPVFSRVGDYNNVVPFVQPETKTIILFVDVGRIREDLSGIGRLAFSKYAYSGERISTFRLSIPGQYTTYLWHNMKPLRPMDDSGSVFATRIELYEHGENPEPILLQFDEKIDELRVWDHPLPPDSDLPGYSIAWWKDTFYGFREKLTTGTGHVLSFMGTLGAPTYATLITDDDIRPERNGFDEPVLLNEMYVISVSSQYIYLLCFHENSNRPKEDGNFFNVGELEIL